MNVVEAIRSRMSIRGYKPDMVDMDTIAELLEIAARAPSTRNIQPWKAHVLTGEVLDKIRRGNVAQLNAGVAPCVEVLTDSPHEDREPAYRTRQVALAKRHFQAMDIQRDDAQARKEWLERGFRFFDAPVAIILSASDALTEPVMAFNIALFAQTFCLAAVEYGLGTCITQQGVYYPEVIRRSIKIPESQRIIIGISLGYPDEAFPADNVRPAREPVDVFAQCYGFQLQGPC